MMKKLLLVSAIPANALYQASKAAAIPNAPPALIKELLGAPPVCFWYPSAKNKKAKSRVRKSRKKATVDLRVQRRSIVVNTNQP